VPLEEHLRSRPGFCGVLVNQSLAFCMVFCRSLFVLLFWPLFSAISWREEEIRFILDQHAYLDFYSSCSLTQQSADRHVAPLGNIILIPSQAIFVIHPLPEGGGTYTVLPLSVCLSVRPSFLPSVLPSVQDIFRRIFLSNC
jgi:hypothetical protein